MEESAKRKERLKSMISNNNTCSSSSTSSLPNPFLERPEDESHGSPPPPKFGFYTDPMAAFSKNNRRPTSNFHPSPCGALLGVKTLSFPAEVTVSKNPETPVSSAHQFQSSYSPYQNMHQGGDPYCSPHHPTTRMGMRGPYPMNQGSPSFGPPRGWDHQFNNSPSPGGSPYPVHQGSPNFRSPPPGRGYWHNNSPYPGRGSGRGGSPSPGFGRGRGQWDGSGRGSGSRYSGGRGRGFDFDGRAQSFYHKSMVEDPWASLTPVIWKAEKSTWSKYHNNASLQNTPTAKKPRVLDPLGTSNSNQSLAEYLAASLNEAVGDVTGS